MGNKPVLTAVPAGTPELRLGIAGKSLKVRAAISKSGNLVWGVMRSTATSLPFGGIPIKALAEVLPTEVSLSNPAGGTSLTLDLTDGPKVDKAGEPVSPSKVGSKTVTVPGTEESRIFDVKVTARKDGLWNIKVSLRNQGGGGNGATAVEDIFAEDDLTEA